MEIVSKIRLYGASTNSTADTGVDVLQNYKPPLLTARARGSELNSRSIIETDSSDQTGRGRSSLPPPAAAHDDAAIPARRGGQSDAHRPGAVLGQGYRGDYTAGGTTAGTGARRNAPAARRRRGRP